MSSISLCLIVKNEAERLPDCLRSARSVVDEVIVVDTGSTDDTASMARDLGAKVSSFDWCGDFSAARNESIRHATGDWILVLDADERLTPASAAKVRQLSKQDEYDACLVQIRSPYSFAQSVLHVSTVLATRLFRNRPHLRYVRRLHEKVDVTAATVGLTNICVDHLGYLDDIAEKHRRNYAITSMPDKLDAFDRFDIARRDDALGSPEEAAATLRALIADDATPRWLLAQSHLMLGEIEFSKKNVREALYAWSTASEFDPSLVSPRLKLGGVHYRSGEFEAALDQFKEAARLLEFGPLRGAIIDDEITLPEVYTLATACALKLELKAEAEDFVRRFENSPSEEISARIVSFDLSLRK